MKQDIRKNISILCMGWLLILSGCSSGPEEQVKAFVQDTKNQIPQPITPLPELLLTDAFTYDAASLRSPFEPALTACLEKPSFDLEQSQPKELLEHYPLDSLRMVGTLMRHNEIRALIRDGSGLIHTVKVNDGIGQHGGKIISISENAIEILEWVMDNTGSWMERKVPINLI